MSLLLDTHVLVWLVKGVDALAPRHRSRLEAAAATEALEISAISFWEVAMLARSGRVSLTRSVIDWRREVLGTGRFAERAVTGEVAVESVMLPGELHADPADRLLVATARLDGATLVTHDRRIIEYSEQGHVRVLAV